MKEPKNNKYKVIQLMKTWLSDKPFWVWLLSFSCITALLFLIFFLIGRTLMSRTWIIIITILVTGFIWSRIMYSKRADYDKLIKKSSKPKKQETE